MVDFSKTIEYIKTIESFLGVSRNWNFTDQRSWKRLLSVAFWIVSSISAIFFIETYLQFYEHEYPERTIRVNTILTTANTILTIVWGSATSKQFEELLFNISETHFHLKRYPEYVQRNMNLCTGVAIMLVTFLMVNATGSLSLTIVRMKTDIIEVPFEFYWVNVMFLTCHIRAGIGYLLFYCILKVMTVQFEFIAYDVKEIGKKLRSTFEENEFYGEFAESLDDLCTAYIHTCNSCRLINNIFSVPVIMDIKQRLFHERTLLNLTTATFI